MEQEIRADKWKVLSRLTLIIFLVVITPFFIAGFYAEGKEYAIFFFVFLVLLMMPDLVIPVFFKPVSVLLLDDQIILSYFTGVKKVLKTTHLKGYSESKEQTSRFKRIQNWYGTILYLQNGEHVHVSGITIDNVAPLTEYLNHNQVQFYGQEGMVPPFLFPFNRYKYDK